MDNNTEIKNSNESCWKSIGVWARGGERCPQLSEIVHCRNCPVFIDAGSNLLSCDLPPGYLDEWTEIIARQKDTQKTNNISVIIFRIGNEYLALRSVIFREVVNVRKIHRIPHRTNEVLLGMTNIRGELHLCFSLNALIGNDSQAETEKTEGTEAKMMVIQDSGNCWVFEVDQVLGVFHCDDNIAQNVPVTVSKATGTFTQKILLHNQREVGLLDHELLIYALGKKTS